MWGLTAAYREAVRVVDPRTCHPWAYDYYWEGEQGGLLPDMVRRGLCPGQKAGELWAAFEGRVRARLSGFKESKR